MTTCRTNFLLLETEASKRKKKKRQGWAFLKADMAAVHFSPDLLSEKPVTSLMINAPARRFGNFWFSDKTGAPQPGGIAVWFE